MGRIAERKQRFPIGKNGGSDQRFIWESKQGKAMKAEEWKKFPDRRDWNGKWKPIPIAVCWYL